MPAPLRFLTQAVNREEHPQALAALEKYADILKDTLVKLCGLKEFSHVAFLEQPTSYQVRGGWIAHGLGLVIMHACRSASCTVNRHELCVLSVS